MVNSKITLDNLLILWNLLKSKTNFEITAAHGVLEFKFGNDEITDIINFLSDNSLLEDSGSTFFSIKVNNEEKSLIFFKNLNALLNSLKENHTIIDSLDMFVFDFDDHYLFYDHETKLLKSNSTFQYTQYLFDHYLTYSNLLQRFKSNIPTLVELEKTTSTENELIVVSKGTESFVASIKYKEIDNTIFQKEFIPIRLSEFEMNVSKEEWLASFKSTLCQFIDLQNDLNKTFGNVYQNFTYLLNQTNKNYNLFLSKFSFEKIRKQFKVEKSSYFESLNNAQDKISAQVISIPLSLGTSIFSFYQLSANYKTILLIYFAIALYSLFIIFIIYINIKDVNKVAKDINEEQKNLKLHFEELSIDFEDDFSYMKSKRRFIRFLGVSIIVSLLLTFVAITYYIIHFEYVDVKAQFKLI